MTQKHCLLARICIGRKGKNRDCQMDWVILTKKKILSIFTLKIICNIYFMTNHLLVFIGLRVNSEPDTPSSQEWEQGWLTEFCVCRV